MPCTADASQYNQELSAQRREIDHLTRLLCQACENARPEDLTADLQAWWARHQEHDRQRAVREEQARVAAIEHTKQAIARLTAELAAREEGR